MDGILKNAMAIFGKALALNGSEISFLREESKWDTFLNYFFAVFFSFCFALGLFVNPFIIVHHAKQKKSYAKFLFLIVSSIDQFKLLYSPVFLVPSLISPLDETDYYINFTPESVPWTVYSNSFHGYFVWFEMDALVVLSVSRYLTFTRPLSSSRKRNFAFSAVLLMSLLKWVSSFAAIHIDNNISHYHRISGTVAFMSFQRLITYILGGSSSLILVIGVIFTALTIHYLRGSDIISSETSSKNIRRGIVFLIATSLFNVIVLISCIAFQIIQSIRLGKYQVDRYYSTLWDLLLFSVLYGIPTSQSVFNSVSFIFISCEFREFVKKSVREVRNRTVAVMS